MGACSALILVSGAGPFSRRGTKQQQLACVILQPLRLHRTSACVFVGHGLVAGQSVRRRGNGTQQHAFVILQPLRRHRSKTNACVFVGCLLDVLMSGQSMCRIGKTLGHSSLQTQDASPCACTGPLHAAVRVLYIKKNLATYSSCTQRSKIIHSPPLATAPLQVTSASPPTLAPFPLPPLPLSPPSAGTPWHTPFPPCPYTPNCSHTCISASTPESTR